MAQITLNTSGKAHAASLISSGKVDKTSSWSFSAADGDALLGASGDNWTNYGSFHLGIDTSQDSKTKAHWHYPFGKDGKVYRKALIAIRSRASAENATAIFDAAGALIDKIDGNTAWRDEEDFTMAATNASTHRLLVGGQMMLYGDVGDMWGDGSGFSATDVVEALAIHGAKPITVRLNSPGGFVSHGSAIYTALKSHPADVTVQVDGQAASAASLIAMAAKNRAMSRAALMMIHDPSGVTRGTAEDHIAAAAVLNKMGDLYASIYAEASGNTDSQVREMMKAETWMTADEAVANGFADSIMDDSPAVDITPFDYTLYNRAPDRVKSYHRDLPTNAARAANTENEEMTHRIISEARAKAEKIVNDAKAEAEALVAEARAGTDEAAKAKADKDAAKKIADAAVAAQKVIDDATAEDAANQTMILDKCAVAKLSLDEARAILKDSDGDPNEARDMIIDKIAAKHGADEHHNGAISVTADAADKFVEGATKGLLLRSGLGFKSDMVERNEFTGMTLRELAMDSLRLKGINKRYTDPMKMVGDAFFMVAGGHSTSDFSEILANVANKSMLKGYEEAGETFQVWTSVGVLTDFKATKRVDLNLFPNLLEVPEGAEYQFATIGEHGESVTLATYGRKFAINRQTIINDDLGAFTKIPMKMGRAAIRTVGNLVYAQLTPDTNPLADGYDLFDATHHLNYQASGGAPSVSTIQRGVASMMLQKDPDNIAAGGLNIQPKFLLVPVELKGSADTLMAAQNDPAATTPNVPNPVRGTLTVVADARLSTKSTKEWYLSADPNAFDVVEVSYLNGNQAPVIENRVGWDVDGEEFKIRIDAVAKVLGHRGLYKDNGEE